MPQPEFLADRSLGRYQVPEGLRAKGLVVHTLWSVYGQREQRLEDELWIAHAGTQAWFVLTADTSIRYDVSTRLLHQHAVGVFQLSSGNLPGKEQVRRYVDNLEAILAATRSERPFVYSVAADRIRRVWP